MLPYVLRRPVISTDMVMHRICSEDIAEEIYTVIFRDWNEELQKNVQVDEQQVRGGEDAVPPTPLGKTGEVFK